MKEIPLTQGKVAWVDDEDYEELSRHKWHFAKGRDAKTGYARRHIMVEGKRTVVEIHRIIIKAQKGQEVDHVDRNGINNQKANLRFVTSSQNRMNTTKQSNNTSGFKGVSKDRKTWQARIRFAGKYLYIGNFFSKEEAALAYNKKAKELYGKYAYLNEIF